MLQRSEQHAQGASNEFGATAVGLGPRFWSAASRRGENRYPAANDAGLFPAVARQIETGLEVRDMTVLFADIRGFTGMTEALSHDPLRVARLVKTVLGALAEVVVAHGGVVDKFLGDGIMACWGAPNTDPHHARRAVAAAEAMLAAIEELNGRIDLSLPEGGRLPTIRIGVGVNSGACVVGDLGCAQHANHSVIGDAVNVASRLVGMTKDYGVYLLIGEGTAERLPAARRREVDHVAVRGRREAQDLFTLAPRIAANEGPVRRDAPVRAALH